jgi:hypothetical protein
VKGRVISGTGSIVDGAEDEARAGLQLGEPVLVTCHGEGLNFYKIELMNLQKNP